MGKAKLYGQQTAYIPNRDADRRRGSKFFQNGKDWTWRHDEKMQELREKKEMEEMARMKEEVKNE